jgi:hypothetical protein
MKTNFKSWFSCVITVGALVLLPNSVLAQTNATPLTADTVISGKGRTEDLDVLEHAYKALHPGLYRYNTPQQIDLDFAQLREDLRHGATLAQTYVKLAEFGAALRCGHTYPNFFNQPKAVVEALFKGTNRVPFEFRWIGERMFVTRNLSGNAALAPGAEVLDINGAPAANVLERLVKLARADGSNDAKRRALLEVQGADLYETFDIYYSLCFPMTRTNFNLTVLPPGATTPERVEVAALTFAQRKAALKVSTEDLKGGGAVWQLSFTNDAVAVLTMPTWALYNSKWDWNGFIDTTFSNLTARSVGGLIIDLRDNEGGLDVGSVIARHLVTQEIPSPRNLRFVRARSAPRDLIPHLDTWDWSFLDWSTNANNPAWQPTANAVLYRMTAFDDTADGDVIKPRAPHFNGKVVVLMNAENSSATFQFEQIAQQNKLATLIGTPSGGNRRGINGGAFFFLTLPNSQIEMDLPLVASLPAEPQPDTGLVPDVLVPITPRGLIAGRDEVMDAALAFLQSGAVRP